MLLPPSTEEVIQVGADPCPFDCSIWPLDPALPPDATRAPPDTTKFEDTVTALPDEPRLAALLTIRLLEINTVPLNVEDDK